MRRIPPSSSRHNLIRPLQILQTQVIHIIIIKTNKGKILQRQNEKERNNKSDR